MKKKPHPQDEDQQLYLDGGQELTEKNKRLHELMDGAATRAWAYTEAYTEKINSHTRLVQTTYQQFGKL